MRFCIKYSCTIAAILLDGTMTSVCFQAGDVILPLMPMCLPLPEFDVLHIDIVVEDMTLINVPVSLLEEMCLNDEVAI